MSHGHGIGAIVAILIAVAVLYGIYRAYKGGAFGE